MKIKFILLAVVFFLNSVTIFSQTSDNYGLLVSGNVNDIEITEYKNSVGITANITLKIVNNNQHKVILVDPNFYSFSLVSLALTEQKSRNHHSYRSASYPTSSSFSKENEKLAKALDSKTPPEKYVIALTAGQSFSWSENIYFVFNKSQINVLDYSANWKTIINNGNEFWLNFNYYLPSEITYFKPNLVNKLPKRWKKYGVFPISCLIDENCKNKDFILKTEPIFIDFSKAKMKQSS